MILARNGRRRTKPGHDHGRGLSLSAAHATARSSAVPSP